MASTSTDTGAAAVWHGACELGYSSGFWPQSDPPQKIRTSSQVVVVPAVAYPVSDQFDTAPPTALGPLAYRSWETFTASSWSGGGGRPGAWFVWLGPSTWPAPLLPAGGGSALL